MDIDITKALKILRKWIIFIVLMTLLGATIAFVITHFFITPQYQSSTQVIVNQKNKDDQMVSQQVQTDLQLVNTYSEIIKSPRILEEVSKKTKNKFSYSELKNNITVSTTAQSQILSINVKSKSAKDSKIIANQTANVFKNNIDKIMNVDNVTILSKAEEGTQVSPKLYANILLGGFVGLVISILIALFIEIIDKRIKNEDQVKEIIDLPVLGSISKF